MTTIIFYTTTTTTTTTTITSTFKTTKFSSRFAKIGEIEELITAHSGVV